MQRGLFITIEGPDGAGKSTQIDFLKKYFEATGLRVVFTREPGGTNISEEIRAIILNKDNKEMSPMTEALLYAASRAQLVSEYIKPHIENGDVVICDRFVDSSIAYQGYGRDIGESVEIINNFAIDGIMPDMTILLKVNSERGMKRIEQNFIGDRQKDRLESESIAFHQKVYDGYLELEKKFPERIVGIDATQPIDKVSDDIKREIENLLKKRAYI